MNDKVLVNERPIIASTDSPDTSSLVNLVTPLLEYLQKKVVEDEDLRTTLGKIGEALIAFSQEKSPPSPPVREEVELPPVAAPPPAPKITTNGNGVAPATVS